MPQLPPLPEPRVLDTSSPAPLRTPAPIMVVPPLHHRLESAVGKGGVGSRGVDGELDLAARGAALEGVGAASHGAGVPGAVDAPAAAAIAARAAGVAAAAVVVVVVVVVKAHEEGPVAGGATAPTAAAPSPLTATVVGDGDMTPTSKVWFYRFAPAFRVLISEMPLQKVGGPCLVGDVTSLA